MNTQLQNDMAGLLCEVTGQFCSIRWGVCGCSRCLTFRNKIDDMPHNRKERTMRKLYTIEVRSVERTAGGKIFYAFSINGSLVDTTSKTRPQTCIAEAVERIFNNPEFDPNADEIRVIPDSRPVDQR